MSCLLKPLTGKIRSIVNRCFNALSIILQIEVAAMQSYLFRAKLFSDD